MLGCAKLLDVLDGPEPSLVLEASGERLWWLSSLFSAVPTESGDCKSVLLVELPAEEDPDDCCEELEAEEELDVPEEVPEPAMPEELPEDDPGSDDVWEEVDPEPFDEDPDDDPELFEEPGKEPEDVPEPARPEEMPELEVPALLDVSPELFGIFEPEEELDVPEDVPELAMPEELPVDDV